MNSISQRVTDLAIQIQQIPAPTFDEAARGQFVLEMFRQNGLAQLKMDSAGNILACLPGQGAGPPLIVSAHLDTVFPPEIDLAIRCDGERVYGPGIGDNSVGVAGLFGLLWMLQDSNTRLPCDLWLVANTGEEGLGDLKGMRALVDRFNDTPRAYLVLEGMALGHIYHAAIGVRRYKITAHTRGGHSWIDYGKPSAIHELARLVTEITRLKLPDQPRTTLNVGRIGGGTSINTLAPSAWLELDLRSEDETALQNLARAVENKAEEQSIPGLTFDMQVIGQRPAGSIPATHPIITLAQDCLREQGFQPELTSGSTDANIPLSRGYPALVLGLTYGGGAHTREEYMETGPLKAGLEQVFHFVVRASAQT